MLIIVARREAPKQSLLVRDMVEIASLLEPAPPEVRRALAMTSEGFFMSLDTQQLRLEIIRVMQLVTDQGLACSSDGNISVRLGENRYLITPSGLHKMSLREEDLVVIDGDGKVVEGKPGLRPTSEVPMHMEAFRQRPDANAVLHAHPPCATALTIAEIPFPMDLIPEALIGLGSVPVAPYATPGTEELAHSIRGLLQNTNSVLLSHHGSLTVGRTLEEALVALERMEHTARTYFLAKAAGEIHPLPPEKLIPLREIGDRLRKKPT
jgi:L-fuculose-phosphate aldolase